MLSKASLKSVGINVLLMLALLSMLQACQTMKVSKATQTTVVNTETTVVRDVCSLWIRVGQISYDSSVDSPITVNDVRAANGRIKRNDTAREAFCKK
jgi:hypothetical protein